MSLPVSRARFVRIQVELGIRYADAEFGRRFGIEHHGGLLDNGRVRRECLSRMFQAIENNHGVRSEQIRLARGQRNETFDIVVGLLYLPLYSLGTAITCRWLCRRFSSNERDVRLGDEAATVAPTSRSACFVTYTAGAPHAIPTQDANRAIW